MWPNRTGLAGRLAQGHGQEGWRRIQRQRTTSEDEGRPAYPSISAAFVAGDRKGDKGRSIREKSRQATPEFWVAFQNCRPTPCSRKYPHRHPVYIRHAHAHSFSWPWFMPVSFLSCAQQYKIDHRPGHRYGVDLARRCHHSRCNHRQANHGHAPACVPDRASGRWVESASRFADHRHLRAHDAGPLGRVRRRLGSPNRWQVGRVQRSMTLLGEMAVRSRIRLGSSITMRRPHHRAPWDDAIAIGSIDQASAVHLDRAECAGILNRMNIRRTGKERHNLRIR
jgi:hypothetical protein